MLGEKTLEDVGNDLRAGGYRLNPGLEWSSEA